MKLVGQFLGAMALTCAGVGTAYVGARLGLKSDALAVALVVLPALLFLFLSEKIAEFKGPAGLDIKFREAARSPVGALLPGAGSVASVAISGDDLQILPKGGVADLDEQTRKLVATKPVVLELPLQPALRYSLEGLSAYERRLGDLAFEIAVVTVNGRLVAWMDALVMSRTVADPGAGAALVVALNAADVSQILALPGVRSTVIKDSESGLAALTRLHEEGLRVCPMVSGSGHLIGLARRDDLNSSLLMAALGSLGHPS